MKVAFSSSPVPEARQAAWAARHPLLSYYAEYRPVAGRVALLALILVFRHSPVLVLPIYIGYVLDTVIPAGDKVGLLLCLVGMMSLLISNMAIGPLTATMLGRLRRDVATRLRSKLCTRIQHLSFAYHDSAQSGRLHSKVMQDVEKVDLLAHITAESMYIPILTALVSIGVIASNEPAFLLLVALFLPVVWTQHLVMKRKVEEKYRHLRIEQEKLNAEVSEMIVMLPLSRAHATEMEDLQKVGRTLSQVREVGVMTDWRSSLLGAQIWATSQIVNVLVVIAGGWLVIEGSMTIGQVVMFITFVGMTVGNVAAVLAQLPQIHAAAEAMRSINEILHHPDIEENEGKPDLPAIEGRIELRDVSFRYPTSERTIMDGLNLSVQPHQRVALVGESGAGKTTFIKLLLGLYKTTAGQIMVDGHDLASVNLRSLRRQVGIVTQETFLFNGTILQNLTHGLGENVDLARVEEAARQANAHDFITALDRGYETEIGDRGLRLSGGQKQRIAIARALLRNPRLLILDEATSALDSESERAVQEALERLMVGRTTFVIAHRLSTVRTADRILVFDRGRIVEDGTHDELVRGGRTYARLVALQSIA
ncbi:ATP-binding cassette domain-containing protein [bacterium]|nr:ATP-binding cassette domain-containing protein [bacterium]